MCDNSVSLHGREDAVLIAPTYVPAAAFEAPAASAYVISLENSSLAELMSNAPAWDIILRHLPSLKLMTSSSMLKPHLGNFTVQSIQTFAKNATPEVLAAIDEELSRLPPVGAPSP